MTVDCAAKVDQMSLMADIWHCLTPTTAQAQTYINDDDDDDDNNNNMIGLFMELHIKSYRGCYS